MMASPLTAQHHKFLASYALRAVYVASTDLESEDSEVQIVTAATGQATGFSVQISLHGGFHVHRYGGEGDDRWLQLLSEFPALLPALRHAVKLRKVGIARARTAQRSHDDRKSCDGRRNDNEK